MPQEYGGVWVDSRVRTPAQEWEISVLVALYEERNAKGLDVFTGERREETYRRGPTAPITVRGIVHAACGTDGWRRYGRTGGRAGACYWRCVECFRKAARRQAASRRGG